jgi:hypothetical protein
VTTRLEIALVILALQAAGAQPPAAVAAIDFDLAKYRMEPGCGTGGGSEIVVCGRRPSGGAYPYEEMERLFAAKPLVAETDIGGGATAGAYVQRAEMPNGEISTRFVVGIKVGF